MRLSVVMTITIIGTFSLSGCFRGKFSLRSISTFVAPAQQQEISQAEQPQSFALLAAPDYPSEQIYCPRVNLPAIQAPTDATQYCLRKNEETVENCSWSDLPLPAAVRIAEENEAFNLNLWFRDAAGIVLLDGNHYYSEIMRFGASKISKDSSGWLSQLRDTAIAGEQIDEFTCRFDELSASDGRALASIRVSDMTDSRRRAVSVALTRAIAQSYGLATNMQASDAQKSLWRLMMTAAAKDTPLSELDLSKVDLTGRNIDGFDFSNSNLPGVQLNKIDLTTNVVLKLAGMDLSGWDPKPAMRLTQLDLSGATNIPWAAINANTHGDGFVGMKLKNLNLKDWKPAASAKISDINYENATNIPWSDLNANTDVSGFANSKFINVDLHGWDPSTLTPITGIDYTGATNIPWGPLNANVTAKGLENSNFTGVNLANWTPATTMSIAGINYTSATNIPWALINANTNANGHNNSDFSGQNLSLFAPVSSNLARINFTGATNVAWASFSNKIFEYANFTGQDLTAWSPGPWMSIIGINYTNATNLPWAALHSNAANLCFPFLNANFTGVDLADWVPDMYEEIGGITYTNASNIPWNILNAHQSYDGFRGSNFSGVDLSAWNPHPDAGVSAITYGNAINIPWSIIKNTPHSDSYIYSNFSGTDMSGWGATWFDYTGSVFDAATKNIPWSGGAAAYNAKFIGVDLSQWSGLPGGADFTNSTNISWTTLNSACANGDSFFSSKFVGVDIRGFRPSLGCLYLNATVYVVLPVGARNPVDFVEATEITPPAGTRWIDGSYPWGP